MNVRFSQERYAHGVRIVAESKGESEGKRLSRRELLNGLANHSEFSIAFSRALVRAAGEAFVWETPPWTHSSMSSPNECVVLSSPSHARLQEDRTPFSTHFEQAGEHTAVAFSSLRGDARLIAPTPRAGAANSAHLGAFLVSAPEHAITELWGLAASTLLSEISDEPRWFSTAGLGVSWLHLRIDSRPKYYRHAPYRRA